VKSKTRVHAEVVRDLEEERAQERHRLEGMVAELQLARQADAKVDAIHFRAHTQTHAFGCQKLRVHATPTFSPRPFSSLRRCELRHYI
jgi:hypothetical protein